MFHWLELISTVRFDLEEGPVVDYSFPHGNFNEDFIKKLAYPSFPDSYTLPTEGQMFYTFQMKIKKQEMDHNVYCEKEGNEETELKKEEADFEDISEEKSPKKEEPNKQMDKELIEQYNKSKKRQYVNGKICFILISYICIITSKL